MRVLTVNAGSSTLKLSLLDHDDAFVRRHTIETTGGENGIEVLRDVLSEEPPPDVVAHRVVHGGARLTGPTRLTAEVRAELESLVALAPLHQPAALSGIDAVAKVLPDVPAVACFDTAFHSTLPEAARTYALPLEWRERFGLRRFGFHGLSHAYASRRAAELVDRPVETLNTVVCHLGAGASLAAVAGGRCVDTTMGFTPLEGLVMATRSGSVDPGMLTWLQRNGIGLDELEDGLLHESGLKGLAGTPDLHKAPAGDPRARLASEVYVHKLKAGIAAMTASLGGLDVIVFTGGLGENDAPIRQATIDGLAFLGAAVDRQLNAHPRPDADITAEGASVRCLVVAAREDLQLATEARSLLGAR